LTFSKVGGPAWLIVSPDGALSGTPGSDDVGINSWRVQVSDVTGTADRATLSIRVDEVLTGPAVKLVHYTFEEGSVNGSTLSDVSGSGNNATLTTPGSTYLVPNDPDRGSVLEATGADSTLQVDIDAVTDEATFAVWFKYLPAYPGSGAKFFWGAASGSTKCFLDMRDYRPYIYGAYEGPDLTTVLDPILNDGNWHHVAWTLYPGAFYTAYSLYIDGVAQDLDLVTPGVQPSFETTKTFGGFSSGTAQAFLGRPNISDEWAGRFDDLVVYDQALSPTDITDLYNGVYPTLTGDITGERAVNLEDFAFLASHWLENCMDDPDCDKANLDTLNGVDYDDLIIMAQQWLAF
jgi:hypothetical protein